MEKMINEFIEEIKSTPIELYSEFGLQHELAIFIRNRYPKLNVRLEYPTTKIFDNPKKLIKKEIDIFITKEKGYQYAIELKMPKKDCGTPKEMYNAIIDVKFLEELKLNGITKCFSLLFTQQTAFWSAPRGKMHIYNIFNGEHVNIQSIEKSHIPKFLHTKGQIELKNNYQATWHKYHDSKNKSWKYYLISI